MEQPWNQQRDGGGFEMGENSCHADLDQAMTEVDGALLMELMKDLPPSSDLLLDLDGDVDRQQLSHVIRSLEAEIGGGGGEPAAVMTMADDDRESLQTRIEDVLLSEDMDGYGYEGASSSSFGYWPQVGSSLLLAGGHDEAEGWCVYTNGGYEGSYDTVDHQYYSYCCAESSADHMYLPLWE